MDFAADYIKAAGTLAAVSERRKKEKIYVAAGHTSNLDIVVKWDAALINRLAARYLTGNHDYLEVIPPNITSEEELIWAIVARAHAGTGGEIEIHNEAICDFIVKNFPHKYGIGGTGVQAANALAAVDIPVAVHLTDSSKEVLSLILDDDIFVVGNNELTSSDMVPAEKITQPTPHYVFQFVKGDRLCVGDKAFDVPRSNRLIVTYDMVNQELPLSEDYFSYLETHAASFSSYIVSGLNCILNEDVLNRRIARFKQHVETVKKNNPAMIVYLEDAFYHRFEFKIAAYKGLLASTDILGLNEEEFAEVLVYLGLQVDFDDIFSITDALKQLTSHFKTGKGIVLHTKDYALFYGNKSGLNIEEGLLYANLLACTRATNGHFGTPSEIEKTAALPVCEKGFRFAKIIEEKGMSELVTIVPSSDIGVPKYTIGLGDTFVAGMQICF